MKHEPEATADLTRNQSLVMNVLARSEEPLSAYTILDRLRGDGLRAPLQVYRALERLQENGMVHRLESLNAFVACSHPECETLPVVAFMICESCGHVEEVADSVLASRLNRLSNEAGFHASTSTIELRGTCGACN